MTATVRPYLALRRALGFGMRRHETVLLSFARFAEQRGDQRVVAATVIAWAARAVSPRERACRLRTVIQLARHLRAEDDRHQVPPDGVFGDHRPQRRLPFIFSPSDVSQLVQAALRMGPAGSLRPHTYATLFALLAASGLRISEALKLRLADVTADGLVIRETKFKKTRLVPLHPTAAVGLQRYLRRRRRERVCDDHVFLSSKGRGLCHGTVHTNFTQMVRAIGLRAGPGKPPPRMHDMRHTMAVRALEACPDDKEHIGQHMLALTTYLGHSHVAFTYWYLEATPHLMTRIRDASEAFLYGGAL
jgi:integrase/recombinase XerD